jgi:flagellar motor switch protein FliN/FliY
MSKDEIDKMMSDSSEDQSARQDQRPGTIAKTAELFVSSVENIAPILMSAQNAQGKSDTPVNKPLSEIVGSIPAGSSFFIFKISVLCGDAWVGYLDKSLALEISQKMMNQEAAEELDEALTSALVEGFNNVLGAYDTGLSEEFGVTVEHSDLKFLEGVPAEVVPAESGLAADVSAWQIPIVINIDDFSATMGLILSDQAVTELQEKRPQKAETAAEPAPVAETAPVDTEAPDVDAPVEPDAQEIPIAKFEELEPRHTTGEARGIELIFDVPLTVTVELGRKTLSVKEILELNPGSLVELEKLAGEAVDLLVNGKLFAKGEVVVIDENFGVRVSSIVTPKERLQNLSRTEARGQ